MNHERVLELAAAVFERGPAHFGWSFHVAVDSADFDVLGHKGHLFTISPEEGTHSVLFTIAAAITTPVSDDELQRWYHICLTAPFVFELIPKCEDILWRAHGLRQSVCNDYTAVKRTACQAAHDMFVMKMRVESELPAGATAKTVIAALHDKSTHANKAEFTLNYIETALAVYKAVCCNHHIVGCLSRLERTYGLDSCLNSISKIYGVVCQSGGDDESRLCVFQGIVDGIVSGFYDNSAVSKQLLGRKRHVGLVKLLLFKRSCLLHFLDVGLPNAGFRHEDLQIIREKLSNHDSYRSCVTSFPGQPAPDRTWVVKLARGSQMAMQLIEARPADGLQHCMHVT